MLETCRDNSVTNILLMNENCALKLFDEIILYYDARSKKHQITVSSCSQKFRKSPTHKQQREATRVVAVRGPGEVSKCCCFHTSFFFPNTQQALQVWIVHLAPSCLVEDVKLCEKLNTKADNEDVWSGA